MSYAIKKSQYEILLNNLKLNLPKLEELLVKVNNHWNYEDMVYRFYHHSFKVYYVQDLTVEIINILKSMLPDNELNSRVKEIINEGTYKVFKIKHNDNWMKHTRPLIEAFFHAKFFLEMSIKYAKELETPPERLPSGWAALLYFYNIR